MSRLTDQHPPAEHVDQLRRLVDEALATLVPEREPEALYEPVRYVLAGQGKRVRPMLVLLTAEVFGTVTERALPAALAVEIFHNFTLVHDDVMDASDERRGRATVHVRWDTDTALLTGDYLLALAYEQLARVDAVPLRELLRVFSAMVARLCEGQTLDAVFETRDDVTVDAYLDMIDRKTGALLQACLELGGILGGTTDEQRARLRTIGRDVGRAFQIQDDVLDLTAADQRWGKPIGGDLLAGKKTYLLLRAIEQAQNGEHRWFARIPEAGGLSVEELPEALDRMVRLGVLEDAEAAVQRYSQRALDTLATLPEGKAADTLRWLIRQMQAREH